MWVSSNLQKGELGYALLGAVLRTLFLKEGLSGLRGHASAQALACGASFQQGQDFPFLSLDEESWDEWSSELVMNLYTRLEGFRLHDDLALDLWILAVGGEARDFWELHRLSGSNTVMASLIERGGHPLRALDRLS